MSGSIVIAHDYFTQRGGAERVALDLARTFDHAPIVTSFLDHARTHAAARHHTIRPSPWNRARALRADPRRALPLLPRIWNQTVAEGDVLVASSSGWAHGVGSDFRRRIVYCHNPARWLYQAQDYPLPSALRRGEPLTRPMMDALRRWDSRQAHRADVYIANSRTVSERIHAAYGIQATVLHPAVTDLREIDQAPVDDLSPGSYLLSVARLMPYKHVLEVAEALDTRPDLRLAVVGDGPLAPQLVGRFGDRVAWLPGISDSQLAWLYANCAATISASHEDFGLTPIEGFQFGRPALLLRKGGFLETQIEDTTGLFFDEPTPSAIGETIDRFLHRRFDASTIEAHAQTFSFASFAKRLRALVETSPHQDDTRGAHQPQRDRSHGRRS